MNGPRLLCFQHRLGGLTGHRYPQALGLLAAARKRHMASLLLMGADATPALRAALPGRPVLRDPTFRQDLSFDQRSSAFEAMLHQYVDTELGHEDWLLITTATQCEGRAAVHWLARIPARRRPWTLVLIPSDRWNRHGPAERERQVAEFRKLAADLASAGTEVRRHLIFATHTSAMAAELVSLLGTTVLVAPIAVPEGSKDPVPAGSTRGPPVVGLIGGARPEKGSDLVPGDRYGQQTHQRSQFRPTTSQRAAPRGDLRRALQVGARTGHSSYPRGTRFCGLPRATYPMRHCPPALRTNPISAANFEHPCRGCSCGPPGSRASRDLAWRSGDRGPSRWHCLRGPRSRDDCQGGCTLRHRPSSACR